MLPERAKKQGGAAGAVGSPPPPDLPTLTVCLVVQAVEHLHAGPSEGDLGREVDGDAGAGHHGDPLSVGLQGAQATQPAGGPKTD